MTKTKRWVLTLDLKDDPQVIAAYKAHHRAVWPEVQRSLWRVGVRRMDIYGLGRRLTMVMETVPGFDMKRDFARHRAADPRCAEWEDLMAGFQQAPPGARPGELWARMEPVFALDVPTRRRPARPRARAEGTKAKRPPRRR